MDDIGSTIEMAAGGPISVEVEKDHPSEDSSSSSSSSSSHLVHELEKDIESDEEEMIEKEREDEFFAQNDLLDGKGLSIERVNVGDQTFLTVGRCRIFGVPYHSLMGNILTKEMMTFLSTNHGGRDIDLKTYCDYFRYKQRIVDNGKRWVKDVVTMKMFEIKESVSISSSNIGYCRSIMETFRKALFSLKMNHIAILLNKLLCIQRLCGLKFTEIMIGKRDEGLERRVTMG
jgi:hypothetical protein